MSDIDWSKAPEGATHVHDSGEFYRPADNEKGGEFFDHEVQRWRVLCDDFAYVTRLRTVKARPVTPAWTGEGLPPVGTVCEVDYCEQWRACEVIAHFQQRCGMVAVFTVELGDGLKALDAFGESAFRPIRTPEQIAAEARESAIRQMAVIALDGCNEMITRAWLERLFDAGYRKTEGGTP